MTKHRQLDEASKNKKLIRSEKFSIRKYADDDSLFPFHLLLIFLHTKTWILYSLLRVKSFLKRPENKRIYREKQIRTYYIIHHLRYRIPRNYNNII